METQSRTLNKLLAFHEGANVGISNESGEAEFNKSLLLISLRVGQKGWSNSKFQLEISYPAGIHTTGSAILLTTNTETDTFKEPKRCQYNSISLRMAKTKYQITDKKK